MYYEIRTPINGVLGYAEIGYRNYQNTEKARNAFEKILVSGNRLLGQTDQPRHTFSQNHCIFLFSLFHEDPLPAYPHTYTAHPPPHIFSILCGSVFPVLRSE